MSEWAVYPEIDEQGNAMKERGTAQVNNDQGSEAGSLVPPVFKQLMVESGHSILIRDPGPPSWLRPSRA